MKTVKDREYSFNHTKQRLLERYEMVIIREDYEYLCKKIKDNDNVTMVMMEAQEGDIQYTYDLDFEYRGKIRVVWSNARDCITTALPRR